MAAPASGEAEGCDHRESCSYAQHNRRAELFDLISAKLAEPGFEPSQKARTVGDYRLGELLYYGPGCQDFEARHVSLDNVVRRVRIYGVATEQGATSRETVLRANTIPPTMAS